MITATTAQPRISPIPRFGKPWASSDEEGPALVAARAGLLNDHYKGDNDD